MISKYLYVESWLIQYELSTRKLAQRRPTRSSAVDFSDRWYLSWFTPWFVGLPLRVVSDYFKDIQYSVLTVSGTLRHWPLAPSAAHSNAVNNIALLGLIAQAAGLVRARGAGGTVDDIQLSELYYALSAKFNECIAGASSKYYLRRCPQSDPT